MTPTTSKQQLGEIIQDGNGLAVLDYAQQQSLPLKHTAYSVGSIVQFDSTETPIKQLSLVAKADCASAKIYQIIGSYKLDPFFSAEVQAETAAILANPGIVDPSLLDYSDKPFCTIDGPNTRDLDQALFIEKQGTGFCAYYAIADAAYYVRPDSAIFTEALQRGASYYLAGVMVPMLPRELCEGVISLNAQQLRRAVVFELHLDASGRLLDTTIRRARIKSRAKLTFSEVQAYFDDPHQFPLACPELSQSLLRLKKVGLLRLQLAEEQKVARYHRTEITVNIGQDGLIFNLLDTVRNPVELYNEQLSLLCNIAGAQLLAQDNQCQQTQAIYKTHAQPPEEKLAQFERTLLQLMQLHHLDPSIWYWDQRSHVPLSDFLRQLPTSGKLLRITQAVNRQALLTNNRSQFSAQPDKHYGVGADIYARFSAPMREMVGVFLHKELMEKLGYQQQTAENSQDESLRDAVILVANRAKELQKQLTNAANKLVMDQLFTADLALPEAQRPQRLGTVIGLVRDKLYILLDSPEMEIKLYIHALAQQWNTPLAIDPEQVTLYKSLNHSRVVSLGDAVLLTVLEKNTSKDQWHFNLTKPALLSGTQ